MCLVMIRILYFYAPKSSKINICIAYSHIVLLDWWFLGIDTIHLLVICITMTFTNVIYVVSNGLAYQNLSLFSANGPCTLCKGTKTRHIVVLHRIIYQPFTCLICMATYVFFLLISFFDIETSANADIYSQGSQKHHYFTKLVSLMLVICGMGWREH